MKQLLSVLCVAALTACSTNTAQKDEFDITSKFFNTWNIYEKAVMNDNGTITYISQPYGGLVGVFEEQNSPVDWSAYESITFKFSKPTTVATQIMVSNKLKTYGRPGLTSLTCNFDGQDVSSINEVALQTTDTTTITVTDVRLAPAASSWTSTPVWEGLCEFGNWENGFTVAGDKFADAQPGDKFEVVFTTDCSDPNRVYWQMKTIYSTTDQTLEGNNSELNEWGCANVGEQSTVYRISLTAKDIENLRKLGMFINGFYCNITQCNLLRRDYGEQQTVHVEHEGGSPW